MFVFPLFSSSLFEDGPDQNFFLIAVLYPNEKSCLPMEKIGKFTPPHHTLDGKIVLKTREDT